MAPKRRPGGATARVAVAFFGTILALCGCRAKAPPTTAPGIGELVFPVVVIHDATSITVHRSREELLVMSTQRVLSRREDPLLVDSRFAVYALSGLRSARSGGELMLGAGTGTTPVEFELAPRSDLSELEAARRLIVGCKWLASGDPDEESDRRQRIAAATTMSAIVGILEGE